MEPEVPGMEETKTSESHFASAAAFVEGGIQEACDDSCSICLEAFCESDPSTVTNCKHEFHLQCILEWCQRSSQCPMCWQPISLKDVSSQELLEGIERERNFRFKPSRNATIFHHPTLGDFELQHLPVGAIDTELEERIIQHLAAAASMGRAYNNTARREGHRSQGRPRFVVFSTHHNASPPVPPSSLSPQTTGLAPLTVATSPSSSSTYAGEESSQPDQVYSAASGSSVLASDPHGIFLNNRSSPTQSSPNRQDRAGPSESQSFSESLTSRLNAVSTRCKESISKSTRGWRERFFSRSAPIADMGSEVRREVHAGIATVSRMIERLDTKENNSAGGGILSVSDNPESNSAAPDISDSSSAASSSSR